MSTAVETRSEGRGRPSDGGAHSAAPGHRSADVVGGGAGPSAQGGHQPGFHPAAGGDLCPAAGPGGGGRDGPDRGLSAGGLGSSPGHSAGGGPDVGAGAVAGSDVGAGNAGLF